MAKKKYYAVRVGRKPGIYNTWAECQKETKGVSGAAFKSFATREEAMAFVNPKACFFEENEKDLNILDIYIDGSYEHSRKRYSFGMVIDKPEKITMNKGFDDERFLTNRNVSGELLGAMYAYQWIIDNQEDNTVYQINYDYEGIEKWAMGEWKTNKALTKCYAIISGLAMKKAKIKFNKVPAHSGVELNEMVDQLAKNALEYEVSNIDLDFIDFEEVYRDVMMTLS